MEHIPDIDVDILRAAITLRRFIGEAIMWRSYGTPGMSHAASAANELLSEYRESFPETVEKMLESKNEDLGFGPVGRTFKNPTQKIESGDIIDGRHA